MTYFSVNRYQYYAAIQQDQAVEQNQAIETAVQISAAASVSLPVFSLSLFLSVSFSASGIDRAHTDQQLQHRNTTIGMTVGCHRCRLLSSHSPFGRLQLC